MLTSSLSLKIDRVWAWGVIPIFVRTVLETVDLLNKPPPCLCYRLR